MSRCVFFFLRWVVCFIVQVVMCRFDFPAYGSQWIVSICLPKDSPLLADAEKHVTSACLDIDGGSADFA